MKQMHDQHPRPSGHEDALNPAYADIARLGQLAEVQGMSKRQVDLIGEPLASVEGLHGTQHLRAVIGAGESYFGIVECNGNNGTSITAITRIANDKKQGDQKTKMVGVFTTEGWDGLIAIGRDDFADKIFAEDFSANLTIRDSKLEVTNIGEQPLGVTDKNVIAQAGTSRARTAFSGLRKLFKSRSRKADEATESTWALSSSELTDVTEAKMMSDRIRAYAEQNNAALSADVVDRVRERAVLATRSPGEQSILLDGMLHGQPASAPEVARSAVAELQQRLYMAGVYSRSRDTAHALIDGQVVGAHGTRSSSLASVLEFGGKVLSGRRASEEGIFVNGGDAFTTIGSGQLFDKVPFAAMTDSTMRTVISRYSGTDAEHRTRADLAEELRILEQELPSALGNNKLRTEKFAAGLRKALDYIDNDPNGSYSRIMLDDFPVIFGLSRQAIKDTSFTELTRGLPSDLEEFRPLGNEFELGPNGVSVIAVPRDRVASVQRMIQERGHAAQVVPIEDLTPPPIESSW